MDSKDEVQMIGRVAASTVLLAILTTFILLYALDAFPQEFEEDRYETVAQVVDGETLKLEGGEIVKLLGVDAAQRQTARSASCGAIAIARAQLELVSVGGVKLFRKGKDAQGRTLAYAYADWRRELPSFRLHSNSINLYMIANGYAKADRDRSHRYSLSYYKAEGVAKRSEWGLWNCQVKQRRKQARGG